MDKRQAVRAVAAEVLAPGAADADRFGLPRSTIDALGSAGLLDQMDKNTYRYVAETIAGADATAWFCWVQHFTPSLVLEQSAGAAREELLHKLHSGEFLSAVAFAHLRRPGPPGMRAVRVADGWRLEGTLDWVTSWDIADVVLVMAETEDGRVVNAFLDCAPHDGLTIHEPLELLAMSGTHTRPLTLDGVFVADDRVASVVEKKDWAAVDSRRTTDANPAAFGLVKSSVDELFALAERRHDDEIRSTAEVIDERLGAIRSAAYAAADEDGDLDLRLRLRAEALDLALIATAANVAARAGASMYAHSAAERRVREAHFLLVQAQTAPSRVASLQMLRERVRAR